LPALFILGDAPSRIFGSGRKNYCNGAVIIAQASPYQYVALDLNPGLFSGFLLRKIADLAMIKV
jgi:hypothetical protein